MRTATNISGFQDYVHDAQATFRTLLQALAEPGKLQQLQVLLDNRVGIYPACATACLTLLDLETTIWLQPDFNLPLQNWLLFHTGCRFTNYSSSADFALILDAWKLPKLSCFMWGRVEQPEASTTLLIQVESWEGGQLVSLTGPGILGTRDIAPSLPPRFWRDWYVINRTYPLGVDVFLFCQDKVMGIPRTAKPKEWR